MNPIINLILFICLGTASLVLSILAVSSKSLLRAATCLLLVLICTAGFYLFLNYHFLAAVQISVYAGGVVVLFIFAIFLTGRKKGDVLCKHRIRKYVAGALIILGGVAITAFALWKNQFVYERNHVMEDDVEISMKVVGKALMGTEKYQYLLPFEAVSLLLLACIVGGIVIASKKK